MRRRPSGVHGYEKLDGTKVESRQYTAEEMARMVFQEKLWEAIAEWSGGNISQKMTAVVKVNRLIEAEWERKSKPLRDLIEDAIEFSKAEVPGHVAQARARLDEHVRIFLARKDASVKGDGK